MAATQGFGLWNSLTSLVRCTYIKYGVFSFALMAFLAGAVLVMIWRRHLSLGSTVLILGLVSVISVVVNQDEIKFRDQRRTAMTDVVALAERYSHCFAVDGTPKRPAEIVDNTFDLLQEACMKLHLLILRQETQNSLDRLIQHLSRLDSSPPEDFAQAQKDYDNALQAFIMQARREVGLPDGKPEYR